MERFRSGNIIMDSYGNIKIFLKYYKGYDRDMFEWISFDYSNSSGSSPVKTYEEEVGCECHFDNWTEDYETTEPLHDCTSCKGTGTKIRITYGEDKYKYLGDNAKDYFKGLIKWSFEGIKMKILFLDIDSVMIVHDWNKADPPRDKFDMLPFTKECVDALNEIISKTNCKIVLSSDHRNNHSLKILNDIFISNGCTSGPLSITPSSVTYTSDNLDEGRCDEILSWIFDSNVPIEKWVAVDDLNLSSLGDNFIGTQMGIHLVKDKIIQFLNT